MAEVRSPTSSDPPTGPDLPSDVVSREVLLDRLDAARERTATLISAPAGYGKTLLVAEWARARCADPVTWCGDGTDADLGGVLDRLAPGPQVVVVDDLQPPAAAGEARRWIAAVADRPEVRLVLLTRADLADELADLRLAGTIDLLRERDLVLDAESVAAVIAAVSGHEVEPALATAVTRAIDGWPAGAALLAGRWDPSATAADHEAVLADAYSMLAGTVREVVMATVGPEVLDALEQVAAIPELHSDLWDLVLGRTDGAAVLSSLRRAGAFVLGSRWHADLVRLHPLARVALTSSTPARNPDAILRQAAGWFAERKLPVLQARCHGELGEWEEMGEVILANLFELLGPDAVRELAAFLESVPAAAIEDRFMWAVGLASVFNAVGNVDAALAVLDAIGPGTTPAHQIPAANLRGNFCGYLSDPTSCLEAAERVLQLCDEVGDDHEYDDLFTTSRTRHWRAQGRASALLAGSYLGAWERVQPHAAPVDAASMVEIPHNGGLIPLLGRRSLYFALGGWCADAIDEASASIRLAGESPAQNQTTEAHLGLGEARRGRGEEAEAAAALSTALDLARQVGRPASIVNAGAGLALLHLDRGHHEAADDLLTRLEVPGAYAPPSILQGRLTAAKALAAHRLGRTGEVRQLMGGGPATAAVALVGVQVALELGDATMARRWVDGWPPEPTPLSAVAEAACRAALAEATGRRTDAVEHLRGALELAEPHRLLQPVAQLAVLGMAPVRSLTSDRDQKVAELARAVVDLVQGSPALALLSDRELLVLHHLGTAGTVPEISRRLLVSANTLRTQRQAIYRKLGVASRGDAVRHLRRPASD